MTSSVKFHAHCGATKEVIVVVNSNQGLDKYVLNDGEQVEVQLWDERTVLSYEQEKESK